MQAMQATLYCYCTSDRSNLVVDMNGANQNSAVPPMMNVPHHVGLGYGPTAPNKMPNATWDGHLDLTICCTKS